MQKRNLLHENQQTQLTCYYSTIVTAHPLPTSRGLTAGSSDVARFLDSAVKPRNVGSAEGHEQLPTIKITWQFFLI
jgi:RPE4 domain-containing protein